MKSQCHHHHRRRRGSFHRCHHRIYSDNFKERCLGNDVDEDGGNKDAEDDGDDDNKSVSTLSSQETLQRLACLRIKMVIK